MNNKYDFIPSEEEMQDYIDKSLEGLLHKGENIEETERQNNYLNNKTQL